MLHLYGDPRGWGNFSPTIALGILWKLSIFAHSIDKQIDAEFIEELFDASFQNIETGMQTLNDEELNPASYESLQVKPVIFSSPPPQKLKKG